MASKHSRSGSEVRMVLVGQEKVGKSSSGNTIMGRKVFDCSLGFAPVTLKSEKAEGDVFNRRVTVVDTPGLYNSTVSEEQQEAELEEALLLSAPGPHAFLYVVQLGRFTEQERKAMETLERILSSDISHYIMVLFTYGDRLEDTNVEQFIREDENLKKLVDKCGGKYHVFNNKDTGNREQVRKLLDKVSERGYSCYVKAPSAKGDHRTERILGGGAIGLLGGAFVGALGAGVVGAALCAAGGAAVGLYISDKCISYYN